jgi:phosphatidylinositol-4,5-bisphosphate 3-kinase catalytic subunit alpha/beta/delta
LSQIVWPSSFGTCLTSLHKCSGIILKKCKVMDSKQAPLWIEFQNIDPNGANIKVMFKVGDDLRQDQMTLQFLDIIDRKSLESQSAMDVCFRPYRCAGTGHEVGMVEMVPSSDTIARMQWAGGGPYDKKPLFDFILANAKLKTTAVLDALRVFSRSCGGYVVATYVMGIGDRHPSNIMMQEDGHLFHIDFGHFLGNFKQKKIAGIKIDRERSPLVFTPQMLHVLNPTGDKLVGKEVDDFLEVCYATYSLLRERASEFITLFTLMVTAGLPELKVRCGGCVCIIRNISCLTSFLLVSCFVFFFDCRTYRM